MENKTLILGQLFLNLIKFSQEYKLDDIFTIITYSQTYESTVFRTLAPQNPANQTKN